MLKLKSLKYYSALSYPFTTVWSIILYYALKITVTIIIIILVNHERKYNWI